MQEKILEIANSGMRHSSKYEKIKKLLERHNAENAESELKAISKSMKDQEREKIRKDNLYMKKHYESLNEVKVDSDEVFWNVLAFGTGQENMGC
jgi:hypothetical protein